MIRIEGDVVTMTLAEYTDLKDDQLMLRAIEDAGVDNWSGHSYALELYNEWKDEQ